MSRRLQIIFTQEFMDKMYTNMWTFMNPDMITNIFNQLKTNIKITYKKDIGDDRFTKKYENSICFKGTPEEGHYVFVVSNSEVYGTYENDLLTRDEDDGVCHGVALIFALKAKKIIDFPIILNPTTREERRLNYISILSLYRWLITSGLWDNALRDNFYRDVTWMTPTRTKESHEALVALDNYISRLEMS